MRSTIYRRGIARSARSILEDDDAPVDLSEDNDLVNNPRLRATSPPAFTPSPTTRHPPRPPSTPAEWNAHRKALKAAYPAGWNPPKKLSRDAMHGLRALHALDPAAFPTPVLAARFKISPEAVRRILKGRWEPDRERKVELVKRDKEKRAEFLSLRKLRERMEARRVAEGRESMRAVKGADVWEDPEADDWGDEEGEARGIHKRDRLTFE
ncbi:hypothetical protein DFH07DRAFT_751137 [Mycena maculata]|uniref:Required for respiratory growth protein 9, mitochondrial n=1 Tax=Mycena maculata TaxID=230809 RepID=A0AAD7N1F5_9AGAR|nr:hypothetical protein DFH07DRAFT_751137 [Mycena maculata]